MARFGRKDEIDQSVKVDPNFKITTTAIKEMYDNDAGIKRVAELTPNASSSLAQLTAESFTSRFFTLPDDLSELRSLSQQLYVFYPIYANYIDYLSNMYLWRYTYIPRVAKDKDPKSSLEEEYRLMGEIVDGLSVETTFPQILTKLFTDGAVFLYGYKTASSKTITTMAFPNKYCRLRTQTQFGTYTYQFDYSYFDNLGISAAKLEEIFQYYPKELHDGYLAYKADTAHMRYQVLNPKFAGAITLNQYGFPTKLKMWQNLDRYNKYLDNELARNDQQLDKFVSHELPTWEDKLIVSIPEMKVLHQSMAQSISKNTHIKLLSTFGKLDVHSIGEDQSKENKTLQNAFSSIYNDMGENSNLFDGNIQSSLDYAHKRDMAIV